MLCIGAIVAMSISYCSGYSAYWTANFLIFVLIDIILMQFIYTLIAICIMPTQVIDTLKSVLDPTREDKLQRKKHRGKNEKEEENDEENEY